MTSWRQSKLLITLTVTYAVFVDLFLYGLIIPILPDILISRAHVAAEDVQFWISTNFVVYNVITVIAGPVFGWITDRWENRKFPLLIGLVALASSNLLFAFGNNLTLIFIARALQSFSASIVWAAGLALLVDSVDDQEINVSMGWVSSTVSVALTAGPLLGGIMYEHIGHFPTFALTSGLTVLDIILRLIIVDRKSSQASRVGRPEAQISSSSEVTTGVLYESSARPGYSENTPLIDSSTRAETEASAKTKSELAIMLTDRDLVTAMILVFLCGSIEQGLETFLALYVEEAFGWSTQDAGLIFLALMVPCLGGPVIGWMSNRVRGELLSGCGFTMLAICHCLLCFIQNDHRENVIALVALLFGIGMGISTILTIQMATITSFASRKERQSPGIFGPTGATAQCCSIYNTVFAVAGMAGPAIAGFLQIEFGWRVTTVALGLSALCGPAIHMIINYRAIVSRGLARARLAVPEGDTDR